MKDAGKKIDGVEILRVLSHLHGMSVGHRETRGSAAVTVLGASNKS